VNRKYHEQIGLPLWLMSFITFLFLSLDIAIWAALGNSAVVISLLASVVAIFIIWRSSPLQISVDDEWLIAGRARIERRYVGQVSALERDEYFLTRGRNADPASFLALRFWINRGVKVELTDTRDATPYWLISSKNPSALKEALKN
jgi:hypothetical protein